MKELIKLNSTEQFLQNAGFNMTLKDVADMYGKENNKLVKSFKSKIKYTNYNYEIINTTVITGNGAVKPIKTIKADANTILWYLGSVKLLGLYPKFEQSLIEASTKNIMLIPSSNRVELEFYKHIKDYLDELDINVEPQYKVLNYRIDFYIPELKIAIEYDEPYHNSKENQIKDVKRQTLIEQELGCTFVRIPDHIPLGIALAKVTKALLPHIIAKKDI